MAFVKMPLPGLEYDWGVVPTKLMFAAPVPDNPLAMRPPVKLNPPPMFSVPLPDAAAPNQTELAPDLLKVSVTLTTALPVVANTIVGLAELVLEMVKLPATLIVAVALCVSATREIPAIVKSPPTLRV